MPTEDRRRALAAEDIPALVDEHAFGNVGSQDQRGVGVEVEAIPVVPGPQAGTWSRATLEDSARRLDGLAAHSARIAPRAGAGPLTGWPAASGRLTFEPGGQVEYSGDVHATAGGALADAEAVLAELAGEWSADGGLLLGAGLDVWHDVDDIPQQLDAPRYRAMDAYLSARSPSGRRMMRHTAALQVNLDPGTGAEAHDRWCVANLAAPLAVAAFACSPAADPDPAVSLRSRSWRQLDPTRTGFPDPRQFARDGNRRDAWVRFALDADVLLFRTADGDAHPGQPGFTFGRWIGEGHPDHGWPDADDLRFHLTTLFPEVRPRGALELRSVDALPARWRAVPVVLLTGLVYDDEARRRALDVLRPRADRLRDDLARAGEVGLKDSELCATAVEVWSFALEGARRLGDGWHRADDLRATERFLDTLTLRGRCPSDELRERLRDDPVAALHWCAEPRPQMVDAR